LPLLVHDFRVLHVCRGKSVDTDRGGGVAIIANRSVCLSTVDLGGR